jgi:hypothetical protein
MSLVVLICLVLAFVLFFLVTIGVPSQPKFNMLGAGLMFLSLAFLLTNIKI